MLMGRWMKLMEDKHKNPRLNQKSQSNIHKFEVLMEQTLKKFPACEHSGFVPRFIKMSLLSENISHTFLSSAVFVCVRTHYSGRAPPEGAEGSG